MLTYGVELRDFNFDYDFDTIPYYCTDHEQNCLSQRGDRVSDTVGFSQLTKVAYLNDDWSISDAMSLGFGLRLESKDYTNETIVMPRMAFKWQVFDSLSIISKAGKYTRSPNAEFSIQTLGNPNLQSPQANHILLGARYRFNGLWETGIDFYHKKMTRLPLTLEQSDSNYDLHYSNDMSGRADGVELIIEKGRFDDKGWYAWATISWSQSERTNNRTLETIEYHLDTPWIFNLALRKDSNSAWSYGFYYSMRSGQKYTPIIGVRENEYHEDRYLPVYGDLNSKRLPRYQRLDIKAEYNFQAWGNDAAWTFGIINATNHENIDEYYLLTDGSESLDDFTVDKSTGMEFFLALGFKLIF